METQQTTSLLDGNTSELAPQTAVVEQKISSSGISKKLIILVVAGVSILAASAYFVVVKTALLSKKTDTANLVEVATSSDSVNLPSTSAEATSTSTYAEEKRYYKSPENSYVNLSYSFTYPSALQASGGSFPARNFTLESSLKKSPIYFAEACGVEQTFLDSAVHFSTSTISMDGKWSIDLLNATLAIHKIASTTVYLTSSNYGYDPNDWGKIKQTITIQDYGNEIVTKSSIASRKVVMETINGVQVRHIMPFSIGRPCDKETREQYQWVKNGSIFSLIFIRPVTGTSSEEAYQTISSDLELQLINSLFSTLEIK